MKLVDQYISILESLGGTVGDDGRVTLNTAGTEIPVLVRNAGDRALYVPTRAQLDNPDWEHRAYFHPLAESYVGGESEIIQTLRELILVRITEQVYLHGENLLLLAIDDKRQAKLKDNQLDVMKRLAETDETTISHFRSIISASTINYEGGEDRRLVAMYLKRGGNYKGRGVTRLCTTFFPVYDQLRKLEGRKAKDCKVFGVDLRLKDVKILTALFEILFPNIEDDNEFYSDGTESRTAPYFTCLMNSFLKIAGALNQNAMLFSRACKELEKIQIKWGEHMDSLTKFNGEIPSLPYNLGTDDEVNAVKDDTPPWDTKAQTQHVAPTSQPVSKEKPSNLMSSIRSHFLSTGNDVNTAPRPVNVPQHTDGGNVTVGGWGAPAAPQQQAPQQQSSGGWWQSNAPAQAAPQQQPANNGWGTPPQQANTTQRVVQQNGVEVLLTIDANGTVVGSQQLGQGVAAAAPANNGWGAPPPQNNGWNAAPAQAAPQQNTGGWGTAASNGWGAPAQNNNGWGGNSSGGWV